MIDARLIVLTQEDSNNRISVNKIAFQWKADPANRVHRYALSLHGLSAGHQFQACTHLPVLQAGSVIPWMTEMDLPSLRLQRDYICHRRSGWMRFHASCSCDLDLDPMTLIYELDRRFWICDYISKMNFLGQGFQKLDHYKHTAKHTDRCKVTAITQFKVIHSHHFRHQSTS